MRSFQFLKFTEFGEYYLQGMLDASDITTDASNNNANEKQPH
jgi:hypothetical protein